jgi:hypothetical protein
VPPSLVAGLVAAAALASRCPFAALRLPIHLFISAAALRPAFSPPRLLKLLLKLLLLHCGRRRRRLAATRRERHCSHAQCFTHTHQVLCQGGLAAHIATHLCSE